MILSQHFILLWSICLSSCLAASRGVKVYLSICLSTPPPHPARALYPRVSVSILSPGLGLALPQETIYLRYLSMGCRAADWAVRKLNGGGENPQMEFSNGERTSSISEQTTLTHSSMHDLWAVGLSRTEVKRGWWGFFGWGLVSGRGLLPHPISITCDVACGITAERIVDHSNQFL